MTSIYTPHHDYWCIHAMRRHKWLMCFFSFVYGIVIAVFTSPFAIFFIFLFYQILLLFLKVDILIWSLSNVCYFLGWVVGRALFYHCRHNIFRSQSRPWKHGVVYHQNALSYCNNKIKSLELEKQNCTNKEQYRQIEQNLFDYDNWRDFILSQLAFCEGF